MTQPLKTISNSFYVLMVDYGRSREAIVNPEFTRRDIIAEIQDILAKPNGRSVAFVKSIDGNFIEDVTEEFLHCAEWGDHETEATPLAARFDHQQDNRKHEVA